MRWQNPRNSQKTAPSVPARDSAAYAAIITEKLHDLASFEFLDTTPCYLLPCERHKDYPTHQILADLIDRDGNSLIPEEILQSYLLYMGNVPRYAHTS